MRLATGLWLLGLGCSAAPSRADALVAALRGGDAAACAALHVDDRDTCELGIVAAWPGAELADRCPTLGAEGVAAADCWFREGERAIGADEPDAALAACARAGRYGKDCGRHLWQSTFRRDPAAARALLPRLQAALPEHAAAFDPGSPMILAQEWKFRLRDQEDLGRVDCGQDTTCTKIVHEIVADRWRAAATGGDGEWWCERSTRGLLTEGADARLTVAMRIPVGAEGSAAEGLRRGCVGDGAASGKRADGRRMRAR